MGLFDSFRNNKKQEEKKELTYEDIKKEREERQAKIQAESQQVYENQRNHTTQLNDIMNGPDAQKVYGFAMNYLNKEQERKRQEEELRLKQEAERLDAKIAEQKSILKEQERVYLESLSKAKANHELVFARMNELSVDLLPGVIEQCKRIQDKYNMDIIMGMWSADTTDKLVEDIELLDKIIAKAEGIINEKTNTEWQGIGI